MTLRNQISEPEASYAEPLLGVNLRESEENLRDGEARLMQNCEYWGGVRIRRGSSAINSTSLGSHMIRGGHRFYFGAATPQRRRLIAYNDRISEVNEIGVETVIVSGLTANRDVFFTTWSITDKVYISNGSNSLRSYDGTTFSTVSGTNIPIPRAAVVPVLDRLFAITVTGIERSDPRSDSVWSSNSSWATLRPQQPGLFTAIHPYTLRGSDTIQPGLLAFQERAFYHVTGSDYGTSVIAASPPAGEDASIRLLDSTVGTASPYSVCTVPGIGIFWFTTDLNVFWLPEGSFTGRYIGDKLQSTNVTQGLESTNISQLSQVWMAYHDHMLVLSIPVASNTYATTQFWLDVRSLREHPDRGPVWYGPMVGQSVGRAWVENQQGDNSLVGGEGNPSVGAFVYRLRQPSVFSDAVGASSVPVTMTYQTNFKSFGVPSREKYVQAAHLDLNDFSGTATLDLLDLTGPLAEDLPIIPVV